MLKPLHHAMEGWTPRAGSDPQSDPLMQIVLAWPEVVGPEIAANARPSQLAAGTLTVTTRSSAWSQQLSYLVETILSGLRIHVPKAVVEQVRFRLGRVHTSGEDGTGFSGSAKRRTVAKREPAATLEEAVARFRSDVLVRQRAKRQAGWKECEGCSALIAPGTATLCVACGAARDDERERVVARLLFERPWLGYADAAASVEHLSREAYDDICRRLLSRWWDVLARARARRQLSRDGRERLLAGAYVMLKSGLHPERIAPATVRNLLGDELYALLYETEPIRKTDGE